MSVPLAAPMIAEPTKASFTRDDVKKVTDERKKRLKILQDAKKSRGLSPSEQAEMTKIVQLEKNRHAAAMSRKKRSRYVKELEQKFAEAEKRIVQLQAENEQLRKVVNLRPAFHGQQFYPIPPPQFPSTGPLGYQEPPFKRQRLSNETFIPLPPPPPAQSYVKLEEKEIKTNDDDNEDIDLPPLPEIPLILDENSEDGSVPLLQLPDIFLQEEMTIKIEEHIEETGTILTTQNFSTCFN